MFLRIHTPVWKSEICAFKPPVTFFFLPPDWKIIRLQNFITNFFVYTTLLIPRGLSYILLAVEKNIPSLFLFYLVLSSKKGTLGVWYPCAIQISLVPLSSPLFREKQKACSHYFHCIFDFWVQRLLHHCSQQEIPASRALCECNLFAENQRACGGGINSHVTQPWPPHLLCLPRFRFPSYFVLHPFQNSAPSLLRNVI